MWTLLLVLYVNLYVNLQTVFIAQEPTVSRSDVVVMYLSKYGNHLLSKRYKGAMLKKVKFYLREIMIL